MAQINGLIRQHLDVWQFVQMDIMLMILQDIIYALLLVLAYTDLETIHQKVVFLYAHQAIKLLVIQQAINVFILALMVHMLNLMLIEDVFLFVPRILGEIRYQEYVLHNLLLSVQTILGQIILHGFVNKFAAQHHLIMA